MICLDSYFVHRRLEQLLSVFVLILVPFRILRFLHPFLHEFSMQIVCILFSVGLCLRLLILGSIRVLGLQDELMGRSLADVRGFELLMLIPDEHGTSLGSQT